MFPKFQKFSPYIVHDIHDNYVQLSITHVMISSLIHGTYTSSTSGGESNQWVGKVVHLQGWHQWSILPLCPTLRGEVCIMDLLL